MKLIDHYDGSSDAFEGDRTLLWISLPAAARASTARLTLEPVGAPNGVLFQEEIGFSGTQGDWGATKSTGTDFVEIDFHKRRTLVSVIGSGLTGAGLQVDMGGVYVDINSLGAIKTPTDPKPFPLPADGTLPGLTVSKFRLTTAAGINPDVTRMTIRSVPSIINVRLGKMAPFWPRNGDLTAQDSSPDFADILQVFLAGAQTLNGYYRVPLVVHSESIARLRATLEVEHLLQANAMPEGVAEVVLPFDFSSLPKAPPGVLSVNLPANAQIAPGSSAKVIGAFDDTRVVLGLSGDVTPKGAVSATSGDTQARIFTLDSATSVVSIDLLIAATPPGAQLGVDLRADFGGKPDATSLLGKRAELTVPSRPDNQPAWVNVPLASEFQFKGGVKYWLVLQSLQGQAGWSVEPEPLGAVVMQHTQDGGLSWRETPAPASASPPAGFFRLRQRPAVFQVPVDVQIGTGNQAQRVTLDRFQPLGRVDFAVAGADLAAGFQKYLTAAAPASCPEMELLANGSFEQWMVVGGDLGQPSGADVMAQLTDVHALAGSADNRFVYAAGLAANKQLVLAVVDVACNRVIQTIGLNALGIVRAVTLYPDGSKAIVVNSGEIVLVDLAKGVSLGQVGIDFPLAFTTSRGQLNLVAGITSPQSALLYSFDTAAFEQAFVGGSLTPLLQSKLRGGPFQGRVTGVAADQTRIYVVLTDANQSGTLLLVDAQTGLSSSPPIPLGKGASAIAITASGNQAVIANTQDASITVVQTSDGTTTTVGVRDASSPSIPVAPVAVAISSDASRTFVAGNTESGGALVAIDLTRKSVISAIGFTGGLTSAALTPLNDEIFVGSTAGNPLSYIPLGVRTPADWFPTAGTVRVACNPSQSDPHIVAVLGKLDQPGAFVGPSAMSQVVPLSGNCPLNFSFQGLSNDSEAVGEVLWRGSSCQTLETNTVPIPQLSLQRPTSSSGSVSANLIRVSTRLTPPSGANAAEVRFRVSNGTAIIGSPSLASTPELIKNGNLGVLQQGVPDQWTLSTATAKPLLVTPQTGEVQLLNNSPNTVSLKQVAAVTGGGDFTVAFTGRPLTAGTNSNPKLEVRWLKSDSSETGDPATLDILPATFDTRLLAGTVPSSAATAALLLSLPPGAAIAISQVSVRQPVTTSVPISFVAQSPGELRVSQAQITFDTTPPAPIAVQPAGLCAPTLPPDAPAQTSSDCSYCACCESHVPTTGSIASLTPAGRPMTVSRCATCGAQIISGGGPLVSGLKAPQVPVITVVPHPNVPLVMVPQHVLTDVLGIGEARARQLEAAGINSVLDLANATPSKVASVLKAVSVESAVVLVRHAAQLNSGKPQGGA